VRQGYVGEDLDLRDAAYDGFHDTGHLWGGLGQLVDGERGPDNFKDGSAGTRKGKVHL